MYGTTKKYENKQPAMNKAKAGNAIARLTLISLSFNAGLMKPVSSLIITGIPKTNPARAKFYGMITNIDDNFAKLRAKLDELGLSDNTIFTRIRDFSTCFIAGPYDIA